MTGIEGNRTSVAYLTEIVLTLHNEVQSALDYIDTVAAQEGTALGKSTAILSIQNLRIKVPIKFNLEITEQPAETENTPDESETNRTLTRRGLVLQTAELSKIPVLASNMEQRSSLLSPIQTAELSKIVLDSKIGVTLASAEDQSSASTGNNVEHKQEVWGEIEITFAPLKREQ